MAMQGRIHENHATRRSPWRFYIESLEGLSQTGTRNGMQGGKSRIQVVAVAAAKLGIQDGIWTNSPRKRNVTANLKNFPGEGSGGLNIRQYRGRTREAAEQFPLPF